MLLLPLKPNLLQNWISSHWLKRGNFMAKQTLELRDGTTVNHMCCFLGCNFPCLFLTLFHWLLLGIYNNGAYFIRRDKFKNRAPLFDFINMSNIILLRTLQTSYYINIFCHFPQLGITFDCHYSVFTAESLPCVALRESIHTAKHANILQFLGPNISLFFV